MMNYNFFAGLLQSHNWDRLQVTRAPFTGTGKTWVLNLFTVCLLGSVASADAATYYRWVDDEGTTHYTSTPPQGRTSEKVSSFTQRDPSPSERSAAPSAEKSGGNGSNAKAETAPQQAENFKDPERCEAARKRVATLQTNQRIRMKTEDGDFRYLSQKDIAEELAKSQQAIEESC